MGVFAFWTWAKSEKCQSEKGMQSEWIFIPYAWALHLDAPYAGNASSSTGVVDRDPPKVASHREITLR
jgi:hypothetical protein